MMCDETNDDFTANSFADDLVNSDFSACDDNLQEMLAQSQLNSTCEGEDIDSDDDSDGSLGTSASLYSYTSLSELTPFDPLLPLDNTLQQRFDPSERQERTQLFTEPGKEHQSALRGEKPLEDSVTRIEAPFGEQLVSESQVDAAALSSTLKKAGSTRVRDRRKKCKNVYKHVPHREKPPHLVARRNARERRRVQSVNVAFGRLRRVVPCTSGRSKRVSKVKTLQGAIDYIQHLQDLLKEYSYMNPVPTMTAIQDYGSNNTCIPLMPQDNVNVCVTFCDEVIASDASGLRSSFDVPPSTKECSQSVTLEGPVECDAIMHYDDCSADDVPYNDANH